MAEQASQLSDVTAVMGQRDVAQGAEMLHTADEITTVSDVVRALSKSDLQHGLSLAGIAGQLATVSDVVDNLQMPVLSAFLGEASGQLRDLAVSSLLRANDTRDLAGLLRRTGRTVAGYGTTEMAEGLVRLAASEDFAVQSAQLTSAGADQVAEGVAALALAQGARDAAQALVLEGVDQIAGGAQAIGASET
jgi:hypothetical protein